ncbi:hypothetical protein JHL22_07330 [Advenella sp. WQ 585]|uniref:Uncharacterized protein n=1 Tax=Advenella mandrilli TaxID=2800330 RepID=A0ABS1EDC3_9BURK|nr:hypothetical protein [Advenella mandrilli]MBK1781025.1 hypothetical protein [Advenella mandrilli]
MTGTKKRSFLWVLLGVLFALVFSYPVQAQELLADGRGLESVKLRFVNITSKTGKHPDEDGTHKKLNDVTLKVGEPVKITFDRFVTDIKPWHAVSGWLKLELGRDYHGKPAIFYELDLDISQKVNDGWVKTYNDKSAYSEMRKVLENTYWGGSSMLTFNFWLEVTDAVHAEVTTDADESAGETGILIPAAIAGILIGGGAAAAWRRNRRKKKPQNEEKEAPEDNPNRYEMRIRKDFGNTLVIGKKVPIYARIVEINPDGHESSRHDLTAKISISSPDGLHISGESMAGDYKAAHVEALASGEIPAEARVSFCFKTDGGSFTNHVVFQIEEEKIVFAQDNLTLPACHEKTERLPFAVLGMGKEALVTASIIRDDGYSVIVEAADQPGLYYAVITEKKKTVGQAGDYDSYTLEVKAVNGEQNITGTLPIYRFNMGLRLDISSMACYVEPYDSHKHRSNKFLFTVADKQYVPAESKAMITLFDWDPQAHSLLQIAPDSLDFQLQAVHEADQPMLEKLAIQCQMMDEVTGGGRALIFRCCKGALDAPSRFRVKVRLATTYGDEKYIVEKEVLLCSQPLRQSRDMADGMAMLKADAYITERLLHIRTLIWEMNYLNKLFPLVKFIDVMLDGYDEAYGYDARQVEIVKQTWGGFLQGTVAGANAQAQTVTFADEVKLYIESYLQTAESLEESLGFMGRMALGVTTLGCSDVVFTSLEVARDMKAYVDSGGDSAWGAFYVGVKVVTLEYLSDKAMNAGLDKLKKVAGSPEAKRAMREAKENVADSMARFTTAISGKNTRTAIEDSVKAGKQAASQASLLLETGRRRLSKTAGQIELDEALREGKLFAKQQVENLQAAAWQFELNPSEANRKLLNDMTISVQQNKLAMYALQNYKDESLDSVRKSFNETLGVFYNRADTLAKEKLASITGIPTAKIQILNASSSSQSLMQRGRKTTIDRDWTAYYVNSKGEHVFFDQGMTEQIYNDSFFEASKGFKNKDAGFSGRYGQKTDQTVIEDVLGHAESYGTDLKKMLDKTYHGMALDNPDKVATTVANKGKEWFERGHALLEKAVNIADPSNRQRMLADAVGQKMEGYRQLTKQFDNGINPRDVARRGGAQASKIPERLRVSVEMCRRQLDIDSQVSLTDLESSLEALGFTPATFADALGNVVRQIG